MEYVCEVCGKKGFSTEEECFKHEASHSREELVKAFPNEVCPVCSGSGESAASGVAGSQHCMVCSGKGVIVQRILKFA